MMTLEHGRSSTWRLPRFSALLMHFRASANTFIRTMAAIKRICLVVFSLQSVKQKKNMSVSQTKYKNTCKCVALKIRLCKLPYPTANLYAITRLPVEGVAEMSAARPCKQQQCNVVSIYSDLFLLCSLGILRMFDHLSWPFSTRTTIITYTTSGKNNNNTADDDWSDNALRPFIVSSQKKKYIKKLVHCKLHCIVYSWEAKCLYQCFDIVNFYCGDAAKHSILFHTQ